MIRKSRVLRVFTVFALAVVVLLLGGAALRRAQALAAASIQLSKTASSQFAYSGDTITYTLVVQNPAGPGLFVSLLDDTCSPVNFVGADTNGNGKVDQGEFWVYRCQLVVTDDVTNTAIVTGQDFVSIVVSDTDSVFVDVITPSIEVAKTSYPWTVVAGDVVTFTVAVTNTGNDRLSDVTVTDPDCSPIIYGGGDENLDSYLDVTEVWSYTCSEIATVDATNVATVTATDSAGGEVSDSGSNAINVIHPALAVTKVPQLQTVASGSAVNFTVYVTNTGDYGLYDVSLVDALAPGCNKSFGYMNPHTSGSSSCTVSNVTDGFINSAVVSGTTDFGFEVVAADAAEVRLSASASCPDDMIAHWALEESSGPEYDDSFSGHDGECAGECPTKTTGRVGDAQKFDGSTTGIRVPAIPGDESFDWTKDDDFSVELWVKTDAGATCAGNQVFVGRDDNDSELHWWAGCWNGGQAAFVLVDTSGDGSWVQGTTDLTDGKWHHVAAVRASGADEIRLYVDGDEEASKTVPYSHGFDSETAAATIGWIDLGGGYHFDGSIDEVAVYGRALSGDEIRTDYYEGSVDRDYCATGTYAPIIVSEPLTETISGRTYTYDVAAVGDPVPTYSLNTNPSGMTIDPATGVVTWVPSIAQEGDHLVEVVATNSVGSDTQSYTLTVGAGTLCPSDMLSYWKLDETTGSQYEDFYGGLDGSCSGQCPAPAAGHVGGAQDFNGSTTGIDVPADSSLNWGVADSFSIELWMRTDSSSTCSGNEVMVGRDDSSTDLHWWVGCFDGGTAAWALYDTGSSGDFLVASTDISDGDWHHVVTIKERSAGVDILRVYVDGAEEVSKTVSYGAGFGSASAALNIGWLNNFVGGFRFDGMLDEIAVYDRALSASEIEQHYNNGEAGPGYCINPDVSITKTPSADVTYKGSLVIYNYAVANAGDDPLSGVTVKDDKCSSVSYVSGDTNTNSKLDLSEIWNYQCSSLLSADTTNTAWVTGTYSLGGTVHDTDTAFVDAIDPGITVSKVAARPVVRAGDTVVYTYTLTNAGDDVLSSIKVKDDHCSPTSRQSGDVNGNAKLDTGETWVYVCSTAVATDTVNTVVVTGTDSLGGSVTDSDTAEVQVIQSGVQIVKVASPSVIYANSVVNYGYSVTNPGDDALSSVSVSDDRCSPVNFVGGDSNVNSKLDPGETWTYACSTTVSDDTVNTATVTAKDSLGSSVSDTDTAEVDVLHPEIQIDKTADATSVYIGDSVVYTYTVTNPGDDPLSNVTVSDDRCSPVSFGAGDANANHKLDVGETWTYTCSMIVSASVTNTATATGTDSLGGTVNDTDTVTVVVGGYKLYLPLVLKQ